MALHATRWALGLCIGSLALDCVLSLSSLFLFFFHYSRFLGPDPLITQTTIMHIIVKPWRPTW